MTLGCQYPSRSLAALRILIYQLRYQLWLVTEGLVNLDNEVPPIQLIGSHEVGALGDVPYLVVAIPKNQQVSGFG